MFFKVPGTTGFGGMSLGRKLAGQRLGLVFKSVDDNAEVWLNGRLVGAHQGYGEQFWFDITALARFAADNRLTDRIEDTGGPGGINERVRMDWFGTEKELLTTPLANLQAVEAPAWVGEAVLYEIFVRDFSAAGDFQGVIDRLDDLQELGVTCIWLMPIHPIGEVKRKGDWGSPYSCRDYYAVTPDFGTLEDFRRLVEETHRRGLRIILDMVLNHSAWDSPLLREHPDWYTRNSQGAVVPPNQDWSDVADFNYASAELRQYMIAMLVHWVQEYQVDGFRFDVAELVPLDFWETARAAVRAVNPEALFLAEGDDPELHLNNFDLTYSWNVWYHVLEVCQGRKPAADLAQTLLQETYRYPQNSLRLRFVENHDKHRAAHEIPAAVLRLAHAFIYTIPGVPLLYNGEEVALDQRLELFGVDPIDWSAGKDAFRTFMESLGRLKRDYPDLSSGVWKLIEGDFPAGVIAWKRGASLLCWANFSDEPQSCRLEEGDTDTMELVFSISERARIESGGQILSLGPLDLMITRRIK